jgi:hypothetical protein
VNERRNAPDQNESPDSQKVGKSEAGAPSGSDDAALKDSLRPEAGGLRDEFRGFRKARTGERLWININKVAYIIEQSDTSSTVHFDGGEFIDVEARAPNIIRKG